PATCTTRPCARAPAAIASAKPGASACCRRWTRSRPNCCCFRPDSTATAPTRSRTSSWRPTTTPGSPANWWPRPTATPAAAWCRCWRAATTWPRWPSVRSRTSARCSPARTPDPPGPHAAWIAAQRAMRQASRRFPLPDVRVRNRLRLLPLPLCIACALAAQPPAAQADDDIEPDWSLCPIIESVPEFPDAQPATGDPADRASLPTDIAGDSLAGVDGESLEYSGNVTPRRGDQFLGADNLEYRSESSTYVASGRVRYQDSGMRLVAERLEGDQEADTHRIDNVTYQLTERRGNGGAERIEMKGSQGSLYGSTYSTCTPGDRWWELRAERIDIDNDEGQGIARNATLRLGRVPVLYVPIFAFPTDSRRKTGLLYPAIGYSSRNGFDWRQPIYLNLAPHYDMTLEPRLMTRRGLMLGTEFRYRTEHGAGTFDIELLPSDKLARDGRQKEIDRNILPENWRKDDRGLFRFSGHQGLGPTWQAVSNLVWISDPRYIEDSSNNLNGRTDFSVKSDIGIYGRARTWDAGVMADYWQLGDYTQPDTILPFHRLPRVYANWEDSFGPWLVAGASADITRFQHADSRTRPGGSRLDVKPWVSMPFEGAAWYVTPTFA